MGVFFCHVCDQVRDSHAGCKERNRELVCIDCCAMLDDERAAEMRADDLHDDLGRMADEFKERASR